MNNKIESDLDAMKRILDSAKIVYTIELEVDETSLVITANDGPNNLGYIGFSSAFSFKRDGTLINIGVWE